MISSFFSTILHLDFEMPIECSSSRHQLIVIALTENEHGVNNRVEVSAAPSHEVDEQNLHNMDVDISSRSNDKMSSLLAKAEKHLNQKNRTKITSQTATEHEHRNEENLSDIFKLVKFSISQLSANDKAGFGHNGAKESKGRIMKPDQRVTSLRELQMMQKQDNQDYKLQLESEEVFVYIPSLVNQEAYIEET
ncbi:hypothetical protein Tco_0936765 [Tanacetum coccineum]|uniref:Uncharacterized protein n=1 Tax=Tanacetum coccineum TaxID=301880 RepID=A0ABQ5DCA5_9ASTR